SRPALAAGDGTDIARALLFAFHHLAEPAAGLHLGERERKDHGRRDAALRRDAGMRGATENLDLPAISADGADGDIGGGAAVVVERQHRRAQFLRLDVARAPQPALLAHAEQERDRRMVEFLLFEFSRERHENTAAAAVVAAERGLRLVDDLA